MGGSQLSTITPNGTGETIEYNHPDRLGTRVISNQTAGTSSEQATLPFGTALNAESTRTNNNKRFTSYDRSPATGLDYAVNRTYDSGQGRFTQVDPIGMSAASLSSPQTFNLYSYCGNDPINHTDSDGLFWGSLFKWISKAFKWVMLAVTVAVAILSVVASFGASTAFAATLLGKIIGFIAGIPSAIGGFLGGVGSAIGGIFSFAEAGSKISVIIGNAVLIGGRAGAGAIANYQDRRKRKPKLEDILKPIPNFIETVLNSRTAREKFIDKCIQTRIEDRISQINSDRQNKVNTNIVWSMNPTNLLLINGKDYLPDSVVNNPRVAAGAAVVGILVLPHKAAAGVILEAGKEALANYPNYLENLNKAREVTNDDSEICSSRASQKGL